MKIFLLGVKHAGKTTVGKFLAQISGFSFFDLDKEIEDRNGTSVRDLYKNMGKSFFMKEEAIECSIISKGTGNSVVSTGGGISDNGEALKIIKGCGVSVFLDIPFDAVWQRKYIWIFRITCFQSRKKTAPLTAKQLQKNFTICL